MTRRQKKRGKPSKDSVTKLESREVFSHQQQPSDIRWNQKKSSDKLIRTWRRCPADRSRQKMWCDRAHRLGFLRKQSCLATKKRNSEKSKRWTQLEDQRMFSGCIRNSVRVIAIILLTQRRVQTGSARRWTQPSAVAAPTATKRSMSHSNVLDPLGSRYAEH